jgi:hypothetical protein
MAQKFLNGIDVLSTAVVDGSSLANGSTVLDVQGSQGQLFSITNSLSGDLFSISDISGIPILNVNSSGLVNIDGNLNLGDNDKIQLGASQDLQIYHDGSHSYIRDQGTGNLIITGSQLTFSNVADTEYMVKMVQDGTVELYYNGSKKLETTSTGVAVTGNADISGNITNAGWTGDVIASAYLDADTMHLSGTQAVSGAKTFNSSSNYYNGHLYYNSYDAAGNHYPHFLDGSSAGGTTVNWRQYYGSNLKTHTWTSDSSGNMLFTYQGGITAVGRVKGVNFTSTENAASGGFTDVRDYLLAGTGDRGGGLVINDISGARYGLIAGAYDLTFAKEVDDGAGNVSRDIFMRASAANAAGSVNQIDLFKNTVVTGSLLTSDNITSSGQGTFEGGGNTLTLKKGTGTAALAFGGASAAPEASGLIEGIAGGGLKFYTSTSAAGTMADPGWSSKLTIAQDGVATFTNDAIVEGNLTVGKDGTSKGIQIVYDDDHTSGARWNTVIDIGKTEEREAGDGNYPTYVTDNGYSISFQSNSDGVLFGMEEYSSGHYKPVIAWGDDTTDSPFVFRYNNSVKASLTHDGNWNAAGTITASNFSGSSSGTNTGDQTLPTLASLGALSTSGGTISGDLTVTGKITQSGNVDREEWGRVYVASNTNIATLLTSDGSALPTGGGYRMTAHISGTGTDQVSAAVFWNEDGTWYCNNTFASGTSSNHIEFLISGSVPKIKTWHTNDYSITVTHERLSLNETGTDNLRGYFGSDSYLSWLESTNALTVPGTITATNLSGTNTGDQTIPTALPASTSDALDFFQDNSGVSLHQFNNSLSDVGGNYAATSTGASYGTGLDTRFGSHGLNTQGDGTYVDIAGLPQIQAVSIWYKAIGNDNGYIVDFRHDNPSNGRSYLYTLAGSDQYISMGNDTTTSNQTGDIWINGVAFTSGTYNFTSGNWYHIVVTTDAVNTKQTWDQGIRIGNRSDGTSNGNAGYFDQVRTFNRRLTSADVALLYAEVETGATADQTAGEILSLIKTVDGASSGLDADTLDGLQATAFATSTQGTTADNALPRAGGTMTGNIHCTDPSTAGTSVKVQFGTNTGWNNNIGIESYWMRLGCNQNEGFKFVDSTGNMLLQLQGGNSSSGNGVFSATFKGSINVNTNGLIKYEENTDIDTGAETVAEVSMASYTAAFFDFVIKKGTNVRSGTVYACHDGGSPPVIEFTETSTNDLGDTSDVTLSVDITGSGGGSKMRLLATTTSDDWSVKSLIRAI